MAILTTLKKLRSKLIKGEQNNKKLSVNNFILKGFTLAWENCIDQKFYRIEEAFYSAYKNDVILAYHWSIKMYSGLPLII